MSLNSAPYTRSPSQELEAEIAQLEAENAVKEAILNVAKRESFQMAPLPATPPTPTRTSRASMPATQEEPSAAEERTAGEKPSTVEKPFDWARLAVWIIFIVPFVALLLGMLTVEPGMIAVHVAHDQNRRTDHYPGCHL